MAKRDTRLLLESGVRRTRMNLEWHDTLTMTVARRNTGHFGAPYVDLVVQKQRRRYGVVDAFLFSQVFSGMSRWRHG